MLCYALGYLMKLTEIHNVITLAQQLQSDLLTCSSHKYIAHQTALLYVSCNHYHDMLSMMSLVLQQSLINTSMFPSAIKNEIENNFISLKSNCTAATACPRLSPDLQTWYNNNINIIVINIISL